MQKSWLRPQIGLAVAWSRCLTVFEQPEAAHVFRRCHSTEIQQSHGHRPQLADIVFACLGATIRVSIPVVLFRERLPTGLVESHKVASNGCEYDLREASASTCSCAVISWTWAYLCIRDVGRLRRFNGSIW